jgi:cytochrome c553
MQVQVPSSRFRGFPFRPVLVGLLAALAMGSSAGAATTQQIVQSCEACHGAGGNSQVSTTPRLNGQKAEYLLARLKILSDAAPAAHAKVDMFAALAAAGAADRAAIAAYFAGQAPTPSQPGPRAAEGRRIFENGVAAENVIACTLCHGALGEGHNAAPRLAGQHADYLKAQLTLFHLDMRQHGKVDAGRTATGGRPGLLGASPDYRAPMNANTKTMSQGTIDAIASYLGND